MNNYNFYWPIYKNIENEFLNLTYSIRFEDSQLNVFSDKFVDLLLRICIEIESISKQLYLDNGGKQFDKESDMYFDTVCLKYLEDNWQLSKKMVQISNPNMYFSKEKSVLYPLKKSYLRGTSGSKWKQAYQSVKHNRCDNYKLGNMENCLNSLAALFVLNIYLKNQRYELSNYNDMNNFDLSLGSEIFNIKVCKQCSFEGELFKESDAIYFINYTDEFIAEWERKKRESSSLIINDILNNPKVINGLNDKSLVPTDFADFSKICEYLGKDVISNYYTTAFRKINVNSIVNSQKFVAFLNKEKVD